MHFIRGGTEMARNVVRNSEAARWTTGVLLKFVSEVVTAHHACWVSVAVDAAPLMRGAQGCGLSQLRASERSEVCAPAVLITFLAAVSTAVFRFCSINRRL